MIILTDLSEVLVQGIVGLENLINEQYDTSIAMQFVERKNELYGLFEELMRGYMTEDYFWGKFLSKNRWPFGIPEIKALVSHNLAYEIPGTFEVYYTIAKHPTFIRNHVPSKERIKGQPEFWLVSDHIAERELELEYLHPEIFATFSRRIWSFDEVAIKRDPGFFQRLIKKNALKPEELLFIDDLMDNIDAAAKAGLNTIWFRNSVHLKYSLLSRNYGFGFTKNKT